MFAREGYPFIVGAAALAAVMFALALRMRSWPLWLAAFVLTTIALGVAWLFRDPVRQGERGAHSPVSTLRVALGQRTVARPTIIVDLPPS